MKRWTLFLSLIALSLPGQSHLPKEGMWLPQLLEQLNYDEMQAMGLELTPEEIFSVGRSSLKDAIVSFGGFCTGSMISDQGLLLTNHHCGFGQIQSHSSLESNYLKDGFWAADYKEELPNPGLTATFIVDIKDVTDRMLFGLTDSMSEPLRSQILQLNAQQLEKETVADTHYGATVKSFFAGNRFYLFITETFDDVRLVGTPPSAIGKFGGDTDNWMWPRHTGDFSLFRIYADSNNQPATFSEANVPYQPKYHLPISLNGIELGDFTMVFGFPGRTDEYAPSYAVQQTMATVFPNRIYLRGIRLNVMDRYMAMDEKIRIQYADKQNSIANGYKKWQGAIRGLQKLDAIKVKQQKETAFQNWADTALTGQYAGLLPAYKNVYSQYNGVTLVREYLNEAMFGIEGVVFAWRFSRLVQVSKDNRNQEAVAEALNQVRLQAQNFFKDYHPPIDKEILPAMLRAYNTNTPKQYHSEDFTKITDKWGDDFEGYADHIFKKSILLNQDKLDALLSSYQPKHFKKIERDPLYQLMSGALENYFNNARHELAYALARIDSLDRVYMQALMAWQPENTYYPNANSTLRITYGQVDDYSPRDGVFYKHQTTLEGILEKAAQKIPDYEIPEKLNVLYETKDYGPYGNGDTLPVCFTASNHTTGGNSGSPVINGKGELIGLNFDRNWEGTMSDIMYDPDRVRNISVDIRYVLFIVDKFAGAQRLVDEVSLIKE